MANSLFKKKNHFVCGFCLLEEKMCPLLIHRVFGYLLASRVSSHGILLVLFFALPIGRVTRSEGALQIRMLIHVSLGFNEVSIWEALIKSLCTSNKVNLLKWRQLLFPFLLPCF